MTWFSRRLRRTASTKKAETDARIRHQIVWNSVDIFGFALAFALSFSAFGFALAVALSIARASGSGPNFGLRMRASPRSSIASGAFAFF